MVGSKKTPAQTIMPIRTNQNQNQPKAHQEIKMDIGGN